MPYYRAVAQAAAAAPERIGVLLVNSGSPAAPTYRAVQRLLRQSLGDHRAVDGARWVWLPLLYGFILPVRPLRIAREYRRIWMPQGSPLAVYSASLAGKVESRLKALLGDVVRVGLAMTHGDPPIEAAIELLARQNVKRLVVLPLHPLYSGSTTGAVFERTAAVLQRWRWLPETRFINEYCAEPGFAEALGERIGQHWQSAAGRSHLLFCYRGVPAGFIGRGDPYRDQAQANSARIASLLGLDAGSWSHCYQRPPGLAAPLGPTIEATLRELAARGVRGLTVVTPSHAVDCLETLYGIAVGCARRFQELGGERLTVVPALNDADRHVDVLVSVLRRQLGGWT